MAKAPENTPTRLIYGFHAVSAKLRHAPDAVLEHFLEFVTPLLWRPFGAR